MTDARRDPFAALRGGSFRVFTGAGSFGTVAATGLDATMAWQVYQISGSPVALGVLGIVRFVPSLLLSLVAGASADSFDRRRLLLMANGLLLVSATGLFVTSGGDPPLVTVYALAFLNAVASTFSHTAHNSLLPLTVAEEHLGGAITIESATGSVAFVLGPLGAGLLIGAESVTSAYLATMVLFGASIACLLGVRALRPQGAKSGVNLRAVREGVTFVFHRQALLGGMTLDLLAVIFGGASALLPIYADEILQVGPRGYGVLGASIHVGAALMGIAMMFLPPIRRAGPALLIAVACFGAGTIVFGLSRSFALSVLAYSLIGAADLVSVVIRHMMVPLLTPPELQGRVGSVNLVFISASNQLGSAESGLVAGATSATFAVVSGGVACLVALGVVAVVMPGLRRFRVESGRAGGGRET